MLPTTLTPAQQIGTALDCLAGVARLRLQHGGWYVPFRNAGSEPMPVAIERVKAPRSGHQIKRTLPRF